MRSLPGVMAPSSHPLNSDSRACTSRWPDLRPRRNSLVAKPIVVIAEELSPATVEALGPDFDVRNVDGTDRPALLSALAEASAILIRSATQVDAEAIAAAPKLKVVARAGVGLDNVDIKAATEAGVMVVNAPTSNIVSAAELTIGHLLSIARHIPAANASLAAGEWKRSKYTGAELFEKTVGIIGLGRIGALITTRLQAFGMNVVAYDPYVTASRAQQMGVQLLSLDELLEPVRLHHDPHAEDARDHGDDRRGSVEEDEEDRVHRQCRPRWADRRGRSRRRAHQERHRRGGSRRLRQRAADRLEAARPAQHRGDAAPRRLDRRSAGEGGGVGGAIGAARARRRTGAGCRQRRRRSHRPVRAPRHRPRREARAGARRGGRARSAHRPRGRRAG